MDPKIGLALGSGGARGFAHVGVLKALKQNNINIDMISGSSMGALIASFYTAGIDVENLYKLAVKFKRKYYLDFTVPKMGFIKGSKVKELIQIFTKGKNIEELSIPISIVTTDLKTGERVVFTKGPISQAVRASISIPGIFIPENVNGRLLVDGGVIDRVPVSVVKEMGADIIIGVDVSHFKGDTEINSIFDVIMQSIDIMQDELAKHIHLHTDVLIQPPLMQYSSKEFTNIEEIIRIGEEETLKQIENIQKAIQQWKESTDA